MPGFASRRISLGFPRVSLLPLKMIETTVDCELCGGRSADVIGSVDRKGRPLQTVLCRGCGLAWVDPRPDPAQLRSFYASDYRREYKGSYRPKHRHLVRESRRARSRAQDEALRELPNQARLLDVGAGAGFFPYAARRAGMQVTGIEPNQEYAEFARTELGVEVVTSFLQDVALSPGSFDAITMHHVLEHLDAPLLALQRLRGWLRPGGLLLLEVPNIEASYHAPQHRFHLGHLYWFNPETAEALARKAGFECRQLRLAAVTEHIQLVLQRPLQGAQEPCSDWRNSANHERVLRTLSQQTLLRHYLTPGTYRRWARRVAGYINETRQSLYRGSPRAVVDRLLLE